MSRLVELKLRTVSLNSAAASSRGFAKNTKPNVFQGPTKKHFEILKLSFSGLLSLDLQYECRVVLRRLSSEFNIPNRAIDVPINHRLAAKRIFA